MSARHEDEDVFEGCFGVLLIGLFLGSMIFVSWIAWIEVFVE